MSYLAWDQDEWETRHEFVDRGPHSSSFSITQHRRSPEDVARIKAERRAKQEEAILQQADAIRARRAAR